MKQKLSWNSFTDGVVTKEMTTMTGGEKYEEKQAHFLRSWDLD